MRIVYLHQYFNTPDMDGGTRSYELARRLVARGHTVHMLTSDRSANGRGWRQTTEAGIQVHWCPVLYANRMNPRERIAAFVRFAWHAAPYAAQLPADIVFATSTPLTIALPAVYAARRQRVPMVFEVRDLWPELPIAVGVLRNPLLQRAAFALERFAYRNAARVVALSPGMAAGVVRTGYPAAQVEVIPNAADLDLFGNASANPALRANLGIHADRILITYAGTLGMINGVDYLVKLAAAALTHAPELHFLIVGKGRERARIETLAQQHGVLGRNLFMQPPLPKSDMPGLFAASDVMLSLFIDLPAMQANSANKFFDALAAGKPVAINYGGWHAELLTISGAGLQLAANDPVTAAQQLQRWVTDLTALAHAGTAARQLAASRFDREQHALQLETLLLAVCRAHTGCFPNRNIRNSV